MSNIPFESQSQDPTQNPNLSPNTSEKEGGEAQFTPETPVPQAPSPRKRASFSQSVNPRLKTAPRSPVLRAPPPTRPPSASTPLTPSAPLPTPTNVTGVSYGYGLTLVRLSDLHAQHAHLGFTARAFRHFVTNALGLTLFYPPGRRDPLVILQDFIFMLRIALLPGNKHFVAPGSAILNRFGATPPPSYRRSLSPAEVLSSTERALQYLYMGTRLSGARPTTLVRRLMTSIAERLSAEPACSYVHSRISTNLPPLSPSTDTPPYNFTPLYPTEPPPPTLFPSTPPPVGGTSSGTSCHSESPGSTCPKTPPNSRPRGRRSPTTPSPPPTDPATSPPSTTSTSSTPGSSPEA